MPDNRKRVITGAAVAAGAVGAYFAARAFMNWRQRREIDAQHYARFDNRARYAQEAREERAREERAREERARGENTRGGYTQGESRPVGGTRYQPHTQPDREPIPATGAPVMEDISMVDMNSVVTTPEPVTADNLSAPLAQYLLTFYDMIHQVRMRRWENNTDEAIVPGQRSLNPTDRTNFQEALDRLAQHTPEVSDGDFEDNTVEQRMYNLMVKVRDAIQNLTYTDDDLFRIDGEIRSQACQVLNEVLVAGQEVKEARQIYECA